MTLVQRILVAVVGALTACGAAFGIVKLVRSGKKTEEGEHTEGPDAPQDAAEPEADAPEAQDDPQPAEAPEDGGDLDATTLAKPEDIGE